MADLLSDPGVYAALGPEVLDLLRRAVESASGWPRLAIVAVYSFLIAFVLPGPSEDGLAAWSERQAVRIARRWGYVGMALALSVPGFPDTISIYAFTVVAEDYGRFAAAAFAGSVGRLLVTLFVVGGALWAL